MRVKIDIKKKYLFFRKDARTILKEILARKENCQKVSLDFSGVCFFSRSFADELLNIMERLKRRGVSVTIYHLNPQLKGMLNRIRQTKTEIQKAVV